MILGLILLFFVRFFLFGDPPSPDERASARTVIRKQRTISHAETLRRRKSSHKATRHVSVGARPANALTPQEILAKTYYNVDRHQPESLDWINVLIAQTIAQLRADALDDDALLTSLTKILNGPSRPAFLTEIKVTDISLGAEFPILSNCRVIPVDESGIPIEPSTMRRGAPAAPSGMNSSLQARMDVDLNDVLTLGIETQLVLNIPKPFAAVLPVALSVSVERFSGTLALSFIPSKTPPTTSPATSSPEDDNYRSDDHDGPPSISSHSPTTLTFTFLDDYRLDLSVTSLVGSRSRLQDVPKIAQLVEQQLHTWFDERCVEPRFQQIVLPSLWPRKRNVRGGGAEEQRESAVEEENDHAELGIKLDGTGKARTASGTFASNARRIPADLAVDADSITQAGAEIRSAEERDRHRKRQTYQALQT